jgi:hypothetical protein
VTLRISWSGLRTHEECRQRGFLTRTQKRAPLANTRNYFAGNVTDRVVREFLNNGGEGDMPAMVEAIMDRELKIIAEGDPEKGVEPGVMKWRDSGDRAKVTAECKEAVALILPALEKFVLPYEYQPDFKFQAPVTVPHPDGGMETILLIGYMDIIVRDDRGRWWVWDVKHTKDNSYWRKTYPQLSFYDLAVELMFGQPTIRTGLLQPLATPGVLPFQINANERAQLMPRIVNMAHDIWKEDHTPRNDNTLCGWCEVRHACSKFAPVVQEDGKRRISLTRRTS